MYKDIDDKIKSLAQLVFWISILVGGIGLLYSISKLSSGLIYSSILIVSGIISSYFIYGFGKIIEHLKNIDYHLNGSPKEEPEKEQYDVAE